MVGLLFNRNIINVDDETTLMEVLNQTKSLILSKGSELSIELLEDFEMKKTIDESKSQWAYHIQTSSLNSTIDIIIQMLSITWESDNYDVYYSGFPNIANREEI